MKHQRVCTKKSFLWGGGWRAGCVCMRGVAGTGWRWWSFHLFAHTIDSVIKRCEVFSGQRLIVTGFSPDRPRHHQSSLNSHKYVDSPASRPIVSRGKRRDVETRYRKFSWVNQQLWVFGEKGLCELMSFMKKRGQAEKKREKRQKDLFTRTFVFEDVKRESSHYSSVFPRSQRIFPNSPHTFFFVLRNI